MMRRRRRREVLCLNRKGTKNDGKFELIKKEEEMGGHGRETEWRSRMKKRWRGE